MACCNSDDTHKLPLLVLEKSKNPRCIKNTAIPVLYDSSSKGWMTRDVKNWFFTGFIVTVQK
ncbi:hypothetical protein A3Q56_07060 [Intoshia linei]|uniref:DDE-1 domain-containing protein n=1 Tax=Intoshia linei TaxID=1819745 RepID=A0A177ATA8_9BILA|nr:hypothetical protein A3Q56_07060 [Intoshia linei]